MSNTDRAQLRPTVDSRPGLLRVFKLAKLTPSFLLRSDPAGRTMLRKERKRLGEEMEWAGWRKVFRELDAVVSRHRCPCDLRPEIDDDSRLLSRGSHQEGWKSQY
eukprot:3801546-Rhodomonas_salina.2